MKKKKKMPKIIIVTIILSSIAVLLFTITLITSILSVKRTEDAIRDIGNVTYTTEVEEKIDLAISYYDKLDTNIGLEKRVSNKNELDDAKYNYVRLAIKKAVISYNRRIVDGITEEDLKLYVNEAYDKIKKYFSESDALNIEGYNDFKPLLDIYKEEKVENNTNGNSGSSDAEEIEIC